MNLSISAFFVVLIPVLSVYLSWYCLRNLWVIDHTNDTQILHKYQYRFLFRRAALRRLEEIYSKQINECASAADAKRIKRVAWKYDLPCLNQAAFLKLDSVISKERMSIIEEEGCSEEKLLEVIKEISQDSVLIREENQKQYSSAMKALRPFTEKRIHEATTVKELVSLVGGSKILDFLFMEQGFNRIDESLKPLYESKLKKLILQEALSASMRHEVSNTCFQSKCEDNDINMLVVMKRALLCVTVQPYPLWSSDELLSEINLALMKYLEHQNECCS